MTRVLRELCKKNNWGWRVEETDTVSCLIFRRGMIVGTKELTVAFAKGDSPTEAICRAIVEAGKEKR